MIAIEHVTKMFGDTKAVKDLSIDVQRGEFFTFLGPNAAGKTTTIRMLVGLLRPTSGRIQVGGYDMTREPVEAKRILSYIPDFPYLYEKLTAREFLQFICSVFEVDSRNVGRKIEEMIETFSLGEIADDLLQNISHGMKQRVVFASALIHDPRVIVIDEPMVGLDPKSSHLVRGILKKITKEQGVTVFMSTHTLSVAEELADRIGIIHRGSLVAIGGFEELKTMAGSKGKNLESAFLSITGEGDENPYEKRVSKHAVVDKGQNYGELNQEP